jgi:hypothetical protein
MEKARILKQKKTIKQHLDCEASVDEVLNRNRYVNHLLGVMNARGCPNSRRFFRCEECPEVFFLLFFFFTQKTSLFRTS